MNYEAAVANFFHELKEVILNYHPNMDFDDVGNRFELEFIAETLVSNDDYGTDALVDHFDFTDPGILQILSDYAGTF